MDNQVEHIKSRLVDHRDAFKRARTALEKEEESVIQELKVLLVSVWFIRSVSREKNTCEYTYAWTPESLYHAIFSTKEKALAQLNGKQYAHHYAPILYRGHVDISDPQWLHIDEDIIELESVPGIE